MSPLAQGASVIHLAYSTLVTIASASSRDAERLYTLDRYELLDTEADPVLDALVSQASALCDTPIALMSLVGAERQWFKSRVGLEAQETPRDMAFCAHAILGTDIFEVPDGASDERFADNPLVVGDPEIRFYAGAPLRAENGHNLGTLCVIDRVPRRLTAAQREGLSELGRQVMRHIELRQRLRELTRHAHEAERVAPMSVITGKGRRDVFDHSSMALRFGDRGRYTLLEEIGAGAMAVVYAAYDSQLERKVAIKLLRVHGSTDDRENVQREAIALARVSHPNVVQIFEIGKFAEQSFISTEYIRGLPLSAWQAAPGRSLDEIRAVYVQAGRGLAAMHSAGIIHRDFKPANIVVDEVGRPRLVDFGLARILCSKASAERRTETVGTPEYMAPEQHRSPHVDQRADQFSFCAALYEALYRVRPFAGTNSVELVVQALVGELQAPPPGHGVPEAVRAMIVRGLSHAPDDRWPSLSELLDNLENYDQSVDPTAAPRERQLIVAGFLGVVTLSALFLVGTTLANPAAPSPDILVIPTGSMLLLAIAAVFLVRHTLMRNHFHRRMLVMLAAVIGTMFVSRAFGAMAGQSAGDVLLLGHVSTGTVCVSLGLFGARFMFILGAIFLLGASLDAGTSLPRSTVDLILGVVSAAVFAYFWSLAGSRTTETGRAPADESAEARLAGAFRAL